MTQSKWEHFSEEELRCKHCGGSHMSDNFMQKIVRLRKELDFPFKVTSAYRCPTYNLLVSTTGLSGPHTSGRAIDIAVSGAEAYYVIAKAKSYGLSGIGVKQRGDYDSRFIHLDDLYGTANRPRPHIWSY